MRLFNLAESAGNLKPARMLGGASGPKQISYIPGCMVRESRGTCMVVDQMLKNTIGVANTEDLIIEAVRDLV